MAKLAESSKKRPRGKAFAKGVSGNPGGRAKLPPEIIELRALCREHTRAAVLAIIGVMGSKKATPGARVAAASEILDRGWGRPTVSVEGNVSHHHLHESVSDTAQWIEGLLGAGADKPVQKPLPH